MDWLHLHVCTQGRISASLRYLTSICGHQLCATSYDNGTKLEPRGRKPQLSNTVFSVDVFFHNELEIFLPEKLSYAFGQIPLQN